MPILAPVYEFIFEYKFVFIVVFLFVIEFVFEYIMVLALTLLIFIGKGVEENWRQPKPCLYSKVAIQLEVNMRGSSGLDPFLDPFCSTGVSGIPLIGTRVKTGLLKGKNCVVFS